MNKENTTKIRKITYNANDRAIVDALKANPEGLTLDAIRGITGLDLKPGNIVATMGKGLIESIGEVEFLKDGKRKVTVYNFVTDEVLVREDGKAFNYTDNEKEVLAAAKGMSGSFTLAELATAMGLEKLGSGRINGLVGKGNITKEDEKISVPCKVKGTHKVYGFVKDIPADAE